MLGFRGICLSEHRQQQQVSCSVSAFGTNQFSDVIIIVLRLCSLLMNYDNNNSWLNLSVRILKHISRHNCS